MTQKLPSRPLAIAILLGVAGTGCGNCNDSKVQTTEPPALGSAAPVDASVLHAPAPEDGDLVTAAAHAWNGGANAVTAFDRERLCPQNECTIIHARDVGQAQAASVAEGPVGTLGHLVFVPEDPTSVPSKNGELFLTPYGFFRIGANGPPRFAGASFGVGARVFSAPGTNLLVVDAPQWRTVRLVDRETLEVRASYNRGRALRGGDDFAVGSRSAGEGAFVVYLQEPQGSNGADQRGVARLDLGTSGQITLRAPTGTETPWIPLPQAFAPGTPRLSVGLEAGLDAFVVRRAEEHAFYTLDSQKPLRTWQPPNDSAASHGDRKVRDAAPAFVFADGARPFANASENADNGVARDGGPKTQGAHEARVAYTNILGAGADAAGTKPSYEVVLESVKTPGNFVYRAPISEPATALFVLRGRDPASKVDDVVLVGTSGGARLLDGKGLSPVFGRTSPVASAEFLDERALFVRYSDGAAALFPRDARGVVAQKPIYEGHDEHPDVDREGAIYLVASEKHEVVRFPRSGKPTRRPASHSEQEGATVAEAQVRPPAGFAGCAIRDFPLPSDVCALFKR